MLLDCPKGYRLIEGHAEGNGIKTYTDDLDKCISDCDAKRECDALEYSKAKNICKLLTETKPTASQKEDYKFCTKIKEGRFLY